MWIMIAGPYRTGAESEGERAANLRRMNLAGVEILRRGHVPVIGINAALPLIAAAGAESYDDIMMPVSLALAARCDACLRIGGPSGGADAEVGAFRARGLPVYHDIGEIPSA